MKRIVSIQDISCVGKCSQTIALPVLSAMGIECAALPTALLSAHTAFADFVSYDLNEIFRPLAAHWKALGLRFDTIYTGYLGSEVQVGLVTEFLQEFGTPDTLVFIDPAMADHGRLYAGLSSTLPAAMRELCSRADIITPNVTEACFLTGLPYREQHDAAYVRELLAALLSLGARTAIITGIRPDAAHMGVAAMEADGEVRLHCTEYLPAVYHGTGDLFAATCSGALTLGMPAAEAISLAADYVVTTLRATAADPNARWYGVNFEDTLSELITRLRRQPQEEEFP